jgi:hypothetical protein
MVENRAHEPSVGKDGHVEFSDELAKHGSKRADGDPRVVPKLFGCVRTELQREQHDAAPVIRRGRDRSGKRERFG